MHADTQPPTQPLMYSVFGTSNNNSSSNNNYNYNSVIQDSTTGVAYQGLLEDVPIVPRSTTPRSTTQAVAARPIAQPAQIEIGPPEDNDMMEDVSEGGYTTGDTSAVSTQYTGRKPRQSNPVKYSPATISTGDKVFRYFHNKNRKRTSKLDHQCRVYLGKRYNLAQTAIGYMVCPKTRDTTLKEALNIINCSKAGWTMAEIRYRFTGMKNNIPTTKHIKTVEGIIAAEIETKRIAAVLYDEGNNMAEDEINEINDGKAARWLLLGQPEAV
ncbi:hypothetical protein T484DRAFT_1750259 [Baffinella frigidus]|nr:hypothetical protein T484DRAFT_1750259 [Cryptophyta sp. CCMP2293]